MQSSHKNFREAEAEFATKHFRFPTRTAKQIKELNECAGELCRLVHEGYFDRADIQLAQFRDKHKKITDTAKGWRLYDPFEGIRQRFRKTQDVEPVPFEFELTKEEMRGILDLVHRRATTQSHNTFVVHPPRKFLDNPALMQSDQCIDELKDSVFSVVFQDGTAKMLSLPGLMAFAFNLLVLKHEIEQMAKMLAAVQPTGPIDGNLTFTFAMKEIMTPETVKALLTKITFSEAASDA